MYVCRHGPLNEVKSGNDDTYRYETKAAKPLLGAVLNV
jgi:hypothetical protein